MTFVEKHRLEVGRTDQDRLKVSWEGEIYGVGMMEAMAETYPEYADEHTACATMEWFNIHYIEDFAHQAGVHISLKDAEKLGREGAELVAKHSFEFVAKLTIKETPAADRMYAHLGDDDATPEMKALADDLVAHENALRDWLKSLLDGKPNGAESVFAYCESKGISREQAATPRKDRESAGGETQQLVLAFFGSEEAADEAAKTFRDWEKATEYMKGDGIGVLVTDDKGEVKEHKLGRRAGKKGMGVGVALGVVAAIPTGGLSLVGGAGAGVAGGGVIGEFFHKGLKMTDEDAARIGRELGAGHAGVGVLTWDFETKAVADELKELGGTPETHEVAKLPAEVS
jgi:hypothetical protein